MYSNDLSALVRSAIDGCRQAEEQLFRYLLVRFQIFAAHKIKDRQAVDDVAQEACVTVCRKYKTEEFSVGFEAWAWGVLQMTIRNYFHRLAEERKRSGAPGVGHDIGSIEHQTDTGLERQLRRCLMKVVKVNPLYARALALVYQGYKTDEICRRLHVEANHLYVILFRARSMLRQCLEKGEI